MIESLRTLYPSLLVRQEVNQNLDERYKWFLIDANVIIGIHERDLTAKDEALLTAFLETYNPNFPVPTAEEEYWKKVIHSPVLNKDIEYIAHLPYRLVYFSFKENQISPVLFSNAIHELFAKQVSIVWENSHQGVIIEQRAMDEESISYDQIIDILMSDLYINIKFFVGHFWKELEDVSTHYKLLKELSTGSFRYSKKSVMTFFEAVPYLLINQTQPDLLRNIEKAILQEYLEDDETLKMITSFVHSNLNISETSKALHMHRNTLQYRLDRFFENTGLDMRKFPHAMTVYLVILAKK